MHVAIYDDSTNDRKWLQALATENGHGIERLPLQRTCTSACMEQELIFKTVLHHRHLLNGLCGIDKCKPIVSVTKSIDGKTINIYGGDVLKMWEE